MNLDEPCLCPDCKRPMEVRMPIWIVPGQKHLDPEEISHESEWQYDPDNWWCARCSHHKLPVDNERPTPLGASPGRWTISQREGCAYATLRSGQVNGVFVPIADVRVSGEDLDEATGKANCRTLVMSRELAEIVNQVVFEAAQNEKRLSDDTLARAEQAMKRVKGLP